MRFVTITDQTGMEQGWLKGYREGLLISLEACLKLKFGSAGLRLMPELCQFEDHALLEAVLQAIPGAATLEELRVWDR